MGHLILHVNSPVLRLRLEAPEPSRLSVGDEYLYASKLLLGSF